MTEERLAPPTKHQRRLARAELNPLTEIERRAVIAVVAYAMQSEQIAREELAAVMREQQARREIIEELDD